MSDKLTELRGKLNDRRDKLATVFEQAGTPMDMGNVSALTSPDEAGKLDEIRAMNDEMTALRAEIDGLEGIGRIRDDLAAMAVPNPHPGHPTGRQQLDTRSLGEMFTEHPAYKKQSEGHMGPEAEFNNIDLRATLFETAAGWAPPSIRSDRVVPYAVRPLVLTDLLPTIAVSLPTYLYMEETTFMNSAVEVAEGASKPAVALALTQRTETIRKIAGYLPVTDEQLEDVPAARAYIDNRLGYMIRQRLDTQIIAGDGVSVDILGLNHTGRTGIQQQGRSSDTNHDAVFKAITLIRVNAFSEPNAVVIHPTNWQTTRLALATTTGNYLFGPPTTPGVESFWGLNVVITTGMTLNTILVGDWNQAALLTRQGVTMKVGYVNDDLIKNQQTIVAELRAAVACFRPAAFCEVTSAN